MQPSLTLVLVSDSRLDPGELDRLRSLATEGAHLVAWQHTAIVQDRFRSPDVAGALRRAGIRSIPLGEALGEGTDFELEQAVIGWMKAFGRAPLGAEGSFRSRFRLGPLVLWWWAEIYLYHETPLRLFVRDVEALYRLVERARPERILVFHPVRSLGSAARFLSANVEIVGPAVAGPSYEWRSRLLHLLDTVKMLGSGVKALLRPRPRPSPGSPRALFLTHASMWRTRRHAASGKEEAFEMYFDRILPAVSERARAIPVAFGPRLPFRRRGIADTLSDWLELRRTGLPYRDVRLYFTFGASLRLARDFLRCRSLYREFRRSPGLAGALTHRGVPLGRGALASFQDTFLRQFPWAIRTYREVESVLRRERPDVLVLYAESSGLGRAAVAAADRAGIPSIAVQHGIMYPHYYSHEHAPDELGEEGVPIPTRTAVFGELAKELLATRGSYPEERIVVTGSPKFDALVEAASGYDAAEVRRSLGIPEGSRFLVLATRWSAVAPVFSELVAAVESLDGIHLLVKPHQAESPAAYKEVLSRLDPARTRVLSGGANLLELLFASDGLVTVDSLASSEALVLGRPVLVVNLPGNLSALVERGVALGVRRGEPMEEALRALLFDEQTARELERRRMQYIQDFAYGADGRSTERIADLILSMAGRSAR